MDVAVGGRHGRLRLQRKIWQRIDAFRVARIVVVSFRFAFRAARGIHAGRLGRFAGRAGTIAAGAG